MSRRVTFLIWLVLTLCLATSLDALTLKDFVHWYLEKDRELEAARLKLEAAGQQAKGVEYFRYPSLQLELTTPKYSWGRTYSYQYYSGNLYRGYLESKNKSYRLYFTLIQPLPTGGKLSITGSTNRDRTDFSQTGFPPEIPIERETGDRQFLGDLDISLEQPLLGFLNLRRMRRKASLKLEQAKADYLISLGRSLRKAVELYFDLEIAEQKYKAEKIGLEIVDIELRDAEKKADLGLISESEVTDYRLKKTKQEVSLINAEEELNRLRERLSACLLYTSPSPRD